MRWIAILGVAAIFIIVYALFDPGNSVWFPKCGFKWLTGWDCPGCGSQRAVHSLLRLDVVGAMRSNLLLVASIPYIIALLILDTAKKPGPRMIKWRNILFSPTAIAIVFILVVAFTLLRNLTHL